MRKTKLFRIDADPSKNRDGGKVFLLTEMPAMQAELWGFQVLQAVAGSGADIGDISQLPKGVAAVPVLIGMGVIRGIGRVPYSIARPLLDEMMTCVKLLPPGTSDPLLARPLNPDIEGQIEEVTTLLALRKELIELHTGFSFADITSPLTSAMQAADQAAQPSSTTPSTSPPQ